MALTAEKNRMIMRLLQRGWTQQRVADEVGCAPNSVRLRAKRLKAEREAKAEEETESRKRQVARAYLEEMGFDPTLSAYISSLLRRVQCPSCGERVPALTTQVYVRCQNCLNAFQMGQRKTA